MEEIAQLEREQGVQQGEAKLIIRQLKRMLGELPIEVETVTTRISVVILFLPYKQKLFFALNNLLNLGSKCKLRK